MKAGVLGSGMVGQAISARLAELGYETMIGTRNPHKLDEWHASHADVQIGSFAQTAQHGDFIFNATNGTGSLEALKLAGASNLNGKVLVDISNPLDYSKGTPPSLFVSNTDSLAKQIQCRFPNAKVVKALNMVTAAIMVNPKAIGRGDHDTFVCGNDQGAKETVSGVLKEFGWQRITDLGDIRGARGMEMYLPFWIRMWGALGSGMFNVKIVR